MSTVTKERLEWLANISGRDEIDEIDGEEIRELARIALASLEAEAVGEVVLGEYDDCGCHPNARVACIAADGQADWENFKDGTRLYTAPPAPDDLAKAFISAIEKEQDRLFGEDYLMDSKDCIDVIREEMERLNACRAAMLHGADGNAPAHFRSRPAQSSLSPAQGGNSPVIPDGWVACSERMPETAGNYWGWWSESKRQGPVWFIKSELQAQFQSSEITHWMPLPAAPQQEAE